MVNGGAAARLAAAVLAAAAIALFAAGCNAGARGSALRQGLRTGNPAECERMAVPG